MHALRSTDNRLDTRAAQPEARKQRRNFRTGTVLQAVRWMPATALLVVAGFVGSSHGPSLTSAAETFAEVSEPGAIGAQRRLQPGPRPEIVMPDDVQPAEIRGPAGTLLAIETASGWSPLSAGPLRVGLVVGQAYRLRVGGIRGREGHEVFPSIRLLARISTPPGMAWRFPVEITIDEDDLEAVLEGAHVRRVFYASCEAEVPDVVPGGWFDVKPGDDALDVAGTLGDPVAELVIGNRLPAAGTVP